MDPMIGGDTGLRNSGSAGTGGMRIVMVNARTAVLVPADAPDPVATADVPDGGDDADVKWEDDLSHSDYGTDDAAGDAGTLVTSVLARQADDPNVLEGTTDDDVSPDDASDPSMIASESGLLPPESSAAITSATEGSTGPLAVDDAHRGEGNPHWRDQLLSRLDDLGRLLSRALPTPDEGMAPLTAALERIEHRVESAISNIEGRLDRLEQTVAVGTDRPDVSAAETDEAISDLRTQLRMVEVQVGALGRLLVTGSPDDARGSDPMRIRLAELVAREQQLATGS